MSCFMAIRFKGTGYITINPINSPSSPTSHATLEWVEPVNTAGLTKKASLDYESCCLRVWVRNM